jgi:hypothetical protein
MILNIHENECMNKRWWILKMDYKRQTTVLSLMFVLLGMMFIVPAMTEKALATIDATARLSASESAFINVRGHLYAGIFDPPPILRSSKEIVWGTFKIS